VPAWRALYATLFSQPTFQQRLLIVGASRSGLELARELASAPGNGNPYAGSGYRLVGFVDDDPAKAGAGYTFDFDARFCGEAVLCKMSSAAPVFLDVHWHLVAVEWFHHTTRLDVEALWQAARPLELDKLSALQLDSEDTLLHLCVHAGISHSYTSLSNLIDIDRVVTAHPDLDWERFLRRVRVFQVRSAVYLGLHFARELFCTPVPDPVVRDLCPSALRRRLVRRLVDPEKIALRLQPPLSRRSRYLLHLAMIDDASGVFRLLRYLFLPGDEWLAMRYSLMGPVQVRRARFWHPFRVLSLNFAPFKSNREQ